MPVEEDKGMDSRVCSHFGQTPFWAVFDTDSKDLVIKKKESVHTGAGCAAVDEIMKFRPDVVYVLGMGFGAIQRFADLGVKVRSGSFGTIREVLENLDILEELEGSCPGQH